MVVPFRIVRHEDSPDSAPGPLPSVVQQRDILRLMVDATPGLMSVKDASGRFTMANRAVAELYGTTVDQLVGKSEAHVNPRADEVSRARQAEQEVLAAGCASCLTTESITDPRTGSTRWFEMRRLPLTVPGTAVRQVLILGAEITDRKAADAALLAATRG